MLAYRFCTCTLVVTLVKSYISKLFSSAHDAHTQHITVKEAHAMRAQSHVNALK